MIVSQFFEVQIKDGYVERYMELAASLRPALDAMGGCLFIDRLRSLSRENLLLSYQIWQPERRTPYNDPARRPATYVIASESMSPKLPATTSWRGDSFASMYRDGRFAHLVDLPDYQSGLEFGARLFADPTTEYFRIFEVMRDYGMHDRSEAPQYYPPVPRG